ncbi:hypothetical protein CEXT_475131, partial [Caerostris extrusa]
GKEKKPLGSSGSSFKAERRASDISWVLGIRKHREIGIHSHLFSEEMGLPSSDLWVSSLRDRTPFVEVYNFMPE